MINSTRCAFMAKQACATFSQVVRKITPPHANNLLKFFFALFATLTLNAATAWGAVAPVNTVLWGENFAHFGTNTPSNAKTGTGTAIYDGASITYAQSSTNTKGYNEKLAGGTAPELLLSKSNQTWTISGIKTGGATKMSLTFLSNKTTFNVTVSSTNLSVSGSQKSWTISLKDGQSTPETFDLIIKNTGSSNARIDNVSLKVTVAGTSSATPVDPTVSFNDASYTVGQTLDLSTLWTSNSTGAVTYTVANAGTTGASISGSSFTATAAGTCTVKASQAATSAYNAITKTTTITVTAPDPAIITLSEAGQEKTVEGKYVGDSYTLPTSTQTCGDKVFVGWSTKEIATPGDKPTSNFYEPGATVTLAAEQTFYAVFAEGDGLSDEDEVLFSYEGGTSTDLTNTEGLSASGLGSDYADDHTYYRAKLDGTGDYILYYNESKPYISKVIFKVKMIGGENTSKMTIKTSDDGKNYTEKSECTILGKQNNVITSTATVDTYAKYLQLYFTKGSNVGFGPLHIYTKSTSYQNYTTTCAQTYTVTFDANGQGTAPEAQTVEENTKATEPNPAPSATGYTFGGWYTDQACSDDKKFDFDTPITENITLYAKWTINQHTVTLNPNYPEGQTGTFTDKDGNSVDKVELKYNYNTTSISLTELYNSIELEGYQFNGWYNATSGGSEWTETGKITSDVTVYAQWSKLYTITLSENGKETTPTTQTGTSYTLPTVLSAGSCQDDTKEFVGWTTNSTLSSETTPISDFYKKGETVTLSADATTFYAVFANPRTIPGGTEEKEVTATVNISEYATANSWINGTQYKTVNIDDNITATASGDENTGKYYTSGTNWRLYYSEKATLTIEAKDRITINSLKITYLSEKNGVLLNNGKQISSGEECTVNAESVQFKTGLSSGTESGQVRITKMEVTYTTTVQADDIVTYSNYSTKCVPKCKITYNFDGGDGECTTEFVEEGSEYTLCSTPPTRAGHKFINWKDQNGDPYEAGATINSVAEDLTLTAQWQVNSYDVTWMSLGSKLSSSKVNYNAQPTKPSTNPTYLCGTDKEFVGWTTQEIDGVGTPANLYANDFPVVTEATTYHAVFAGRSTEVSITTNTLTITENLGQYKEGTITDEQGAIWNYYAGGSQDKTINLRNNSGEESYLASPKFAGTVQSITAHVTNGSASARKVYLCSSAVASPSGGDLGVTSIAGNNNSKVTFVIADGKSFDQFYIQVSGALQFKDIVVTSGIVGENYVDYVTSCEEVGSDMSNSTKVITPSVESGIFSVGEGKYVQFSSGNLQYEVGTNTWSFASEQYEVIGGEAYTGSNNTNYGMNEPGYTGKLDLFAWSSDGKFGVNPSNTDADYGYDATDFEDWGTLVDETGWYTLTKDEMNYILNRKKDGTKLWALATVNDLVGLILLPDNWDTNIKLVYGYIPEKFVYTKNLLSIAEWQTLEEAGAVFLPAGGSRTGGYGNTDKAGGKGTIDANGHYFHVDNVNIYGDYWLNTQDPRETHKNCASFLILPGWDEGPTVDEEGLDDLSTRPQVWSREKRRGNSVRLVKKVPTYTVSVTAENGTVTGAGTYPQGAEVTLTATANEGYKFVNWTEEGEEVSTDATYTFTATEDVEFVANFKITLTDGDNSAVIAANIGNTVDVVIERSFTANDGYYTLCLPFDLPVEKIGKALQISSITENVAEQGMNVVFTEVEETLKAGQPYLVLPSKNLTNPIFEDVKIVNTTGETTATVTGAGINVTFTGIINGSGTTNGTTEYYVGNGGYLYNGTVDKLGLRAFFTITDEAGNPTQIRARVVAGENVETGVEDIITTDAPVKVIENGQLIIIRGGVKYNVQGQKL